MKRQYVLISILLLLAPAAQCAIGSQATNLDIMGSRANNTTINAPYGMPVDVDIIGSTASNIQIGYQTQDVNKKCGKECLGCGPCGEEKRYKTPWDDFNRPLCYPWSSYIPTRYNMPFIKKDLRYMNTLPNTLSLGKGTAYS